MTGVELGLAVFGLTAQLFVSAVHSYRFISTAQHLKRDASIEFWKLRIQEVRLRSWGRQWGADREEFETFLEEENLVEDVRGILTQIQDLFADSKKLKEKYGLKIEGVAETDSFEQQILLGILRARNPDKPTLAQKFLWSLKDKQKFASLVSDLKELNDGLYCLFDASERRSVGACNESDILRLTNDPVDCEDIQQACITYRDEAAKDSPAQRRWLSSPYLDLINATGAKKLAIEQSEIVLPPLGSSVPADVTRDYERDPESVVGYIKQSPTRLRILAEYRSKVVLIEWKTMDEKSPYQALIAKRMENLARLLEPASPKPSDFRVLDCLGYFRDKALPRYGYLFGFPPNVVQQPPITLHDLLSRGGPHELLLDLGDRFTLARTLASSLLRLHECDWVHTSFRSESILFFFSEQTGSFSSTPQPCIKNPYISGFGYSKPNDPAESTLEYSFPNRLHDLYRHPEIVKSRGSPGADDAIRLQQRHDLFSLGIVLLEIGLWEQIKALWKEKYTSSAFLTKLLTGYVPRLGHKMGTVYRDVVNDLLSMHIEQHRSTAEVASAFSMRGLERPADEKKNKGKDLDELDWWSVVVRLEKCKA
jgi:hypothetical protein